MGRRGELAPHQIPGKEFCCDSCSQTRHGHHMVHFCVLLELNVYWPPESLLTDQGSIFLSAHLMRDMRNLTYLCATQEYNHTIPWGRMKKLHYLVKQAYSELKASYPHASDDLRLQGSAAAINTSTGPDGWVPSLLVFGVLPRMPHVKSTLLPQKERFTMMITARLEYVKLMAQARVQKGLRKKQPRAQIVLRQLDGSIGSRRC